VFCARGAPNRGIVVDRPHIARIAVESVTTPRTIVPGACRRARSTPPLRQVLGVLKRVSFVFQKRQVLPGNLALCGSDRAPGWFDLQTGWPAKCDGAWRSSSMGPVGLQVMVTGDAGGQPLRPIQAWPRCPVALGAVANGSSGSCGSPGMAKRCRRHPRSRRVGRQKRIRRPNGCHSPSWHWAQSLAINGAL